MRFGYDGGRFYGVPPQPDLPTVGGTLRARFEDVFGQRPRNLAFTSRTDSGVHALGNLSTCWIPEIADLPHRLANMRADRGDGLGDIEAVWVPVPMHARGLSLGKHYRYVVETGYSAEELTALDTWVSWRGRTAQRRAGLPPPNDGEALRIWQIHPPLDVARMNEAAAQMVGTHDFTALRSTRCGANVTVKTVDSITFDTVVQDGRTRITIDIRGRSFLRQMVRIMVGTLVECGAGFRDPSSIAALIEGKVRRKAGMTAPSRGLTLQRIFMETDWFDPDVQASHRGH